MERFIDVVLSSCDKDVASRFVPWLYDYVLLKQKIAFESAYTLANKDNDVSQQEIADFIGIDRVTYNRLENEKFSIKLDYAIKIA